MYIPFISSPRLTPVSRERDLNLARSLERRKGGGGGGRPRPPSVGPSGSGGKGSGLGGTSKVPLGGKGLSNGKTSATSYGPGGGRAAPIPFGQPFAGRSAGGGRRDQVYGNSIYGSGYPGVLVPHGVGGLGLPFYFWPVVWSGIAIGASAYLFDSDEYGLPDNSSRPGGPLAVAQFQSNKTGSIFHVLSDNSTVSSLIESLKANCSSSLSLANTSSSPTPYINGSTEPRPEQALQYFRASSVVLTLDGYNDTAALNGTQNPNMTAPAAPLPGGTDTTLLACLNDTIGRAVPLADAGTRSGPPGMLVLVLAWVLGASAVSWL
ncbi:hypothetical protein BJV78DRAFT_1276714 [Lactifluus subvellereus]|nr:hypothetical protein BJV78DRAFT_1276714 [Lactifluus subvellereus]